MGNDFVVTRENLLARRHKYQTKIEAIDAALTVFETLDEDDAVHSVEPSTRPKPKPTNSSKRKSRRKTWTKAEDNRLKRITAKGLTDKQIGAKLKRPRTGVLKRRERLGLMKRK